MRFSVPGLLAGVLLTAQANALTQLDYIVAVVDDDVVLASELISRIATVREQIVAQNARLPPEQVLYSQMLERLIMESLQIQMGARAGVRIDDATLTQSLAAIAQQNGMTLEQFQDVLAADGINYREFRDDVRREMTIQRVQRARVNNRVHVTEEEIQAFLDSPVGRDVLSDEFRVGHILLLVPDNVAPADVAAAEAEAEEIRRELVAGADFRQMAITRSAGSRALEGGDLGWRKAGALPSLFADVVIELEPGETPPPMRSGRGFHIIQLLERRGVSNLMVQQGRVRHILVVPSEIRTRAETRYLIFEIRDRLIAGEAFEDLAREYSDDPSSALAGGDLGWSASNSFVPEFGTAMDNAEVGVVTEPFRSKDGWHILEVQERRDHDMSEEAMRNMAVRVLHTRRFEEELEIWLGEIRDEAYVEIRLDSARDTPSEDLAAAEG